MHRFLVFQFCLVLVHSQIHFFHRPRLPPPRPPPLPPPPRYPMIPPPPPPTSFPESDSSDSASNEHKDFPHPHPPGYGRSGLPVPPGPVHTSISVESSESKESAESIKPAKKFSSVKLPKYKIDRNKKLRKQILQRQRGKINKKYFLGPQKIFPECPEPEPLRLRSSRNLRSRTKQQKYRIKKGKKNRNCRQPKQTESNRQSKSYEDASKESGEPSAESFESNENVIDSRSSETPEHHRFNHPNMPPHPPSLAPKMILMNNENEVENVDKSSEEKHDDNTSKNTTQKDPRFGLKPIEFTFTRPTKPPKYPHTTPSTPLDYKQPEPVPFHAFDPELDPEIQKLRIEIFKGYNRWKKWKKINMHEYTELIALGLTNAIQFMTFI